VLDIYYVVDFDEKLAFEGHKLSIGATNQVQTGAKFSHFLDFLLVLGFFARFAVEIFCPRQAAPTGQ